MRSPRSLARFIALAFVMLTAVSSTSCFDPEHKDEVNALGGEANGVRTGPFHRPGQPCRACHGGMGPGKPEFSIAGTVYAFRDNGQVKPGVTVILTDTTGVTKQIQTNQAGNFYFSIDQWSPTFPVSVKLDFPGLAQPKAMQTVIGRNGGCGFCHYGADNEPTHMPPVFLEN